MCATRSFPGPSGPGPIEALQPLTVSLDAHRWPPSLRQGSRRAADDPAAAEPLIVEAHEEAKRALTELRDLVRGIHPSILTDRGLDAAISALAGRSPVPVEIDVDLDRRPPAAIETAAYYVVAEALTNIAKHSGAREACVTLTFDGQALTVKIVDVGAAARSGHPGPASRG